MAKTASKGDIQSKKSILPCECGEEMKWIYLANNQRMVLHCPKCGKYFDRQGKEVISKVD